VANGVITIQFTLKSGEAIEVTEDLGQEVTPEAVESYGRALATDLGKDTVRTFAYWYGDDFYFDAVRMSEVAAFSISTEEEPEYVEEE